MVFDERGQAMYRNAVVRSEPKFYLPLEGSLGNLGELAGTVTNTGNVPLNAVGPWGNEQGGATFNSDSQRLVLPSAWAPSGRPATLELFVRALPKSGTYQNLVGTNTWGLILQQLGRAQFAISFGGAGTPSGLSTWMVAATGGWRYVAVSALSATGTNTYISVDDNAENAGHPSSTQNNGDFSGDTAFRIGGTYANQFGFLTGDVCHVAGYHRALPPAELLSHFRAATGVLTPRARPVVILSIPPLPEGPSTQ